MRLIEYPIGLVESVGTEYGKQMFDMVLMENYGHAGPIFLRHIISKLPEVLAKLESTQAKIDRELKLLPRERFWSATIAANLVGAIYANRPITNTYVNINVPAQVNVRYGSNSGSNGRTPVLEGGP